MVLVVAFGEPLCDRLVGEFRRPWLLGPVFAIFDMVPEICCRGTGLLDLRARSLFAFLDGCIEERLALLCRPTEFGAKLIETIGNLCPASALGLGELKGVGRESLKNLQALLTGKPK
jgi:hypothetical protein